MCSLTRKPLPRTLFSPSISNPYSGEPPSGEPPPLSPLAPRLLIYLSDTLAFPPELYDLSVPRTPNAVPLIPLVLAPMHFISAAALETLSQLSLQSLSPDPHPEAAAAPGFGLAVLNVISADPFDEKIRLAAAVHFKNHVRSPWTPSDDDDAPPPPPSHPQTPKRTRSKPSLSPPCSKSPAASVPNSPRPSPSSVPTTSPWPGPPFSLSSSPTSAPPQTIPPSTASSAPPAPSSSSSATPSTPPPSASTSITASTASPPPLPEVFVKAAQFISPNATASSPDVLCPFFEYQRLCCRIFHSLNSTELPKFFDDHMREWMTEFRRYLTPTNSPAVETKGTIDALRAAFCENLQL